MGSKYSLSIVAVATIFLIASFGYTSAGAQTASLFTAPPALADLIEEGLTQNGEIQSLQAQAESYNAEAPFAGSLDDPRLGMGILNLPTDTLSFSQEPMTQKQIFVAQKLPWFGKLDLRSKRAVLKAVRQEALLDAKRLELGRKIAEAYYDLGFAQRSLEVNSRLRETVTQMLRYAEMRYATGSGLQQDVLQAQVELSKLIDEKITLEKMRSTLEGRINELINRESFREVTIFETPMIIDRQPALDKLQARAVAYNPWVRARQAEIDLATVEIDLAQKDYWPDVDVMLAYGQRDEDRSGRDLPDFISGSISVNIPLWQRSRQDSRLSAALKNYDAAVKMHRSLVQSLPHRVNAVVAEISNLQENCRLFADALVFQAEQWSRSSQTAYETGAVEFNTMLTARIRYLRFELQGQSYLYQIGKTQSELEEVLGGKL
jgi:cobalt-zinc-cadmium efflux system outer membrane protein